MPAFPPSGPVRVIRYRCIRRQFHTMSGIVLKADVARKGRNGKTAALDRRLRARRGGSSFAQETLSYPVTIAAWMVVQ
jgi:hypothetical protein